MSDNFKELNNDILKNQRPRVDGLGFDHNSIILINGKLDTFNFKLENLKNKNSVLVEELNLNHHLNFAEELKNNSMQNLNTALNEGGFV